MTVKEWVNTEQAKHRVCACGCGEEIIILNQHRCKGIPNYKRYHYYNNINVNGWMIREQGIHFCKCGCGSEIIIKRGHYSQGIPEYILRHNPCTDETRVKMSESKKRRVYSKETRKKMSESNKGHVLTDETRKKISDAVSGANSPNWQGGISFEPYCHKFNTQLKEKVRDRFGRKCYVCGVCENGRRLSIHHVTYDKMDGCSGNNFILIPLCQSCHSKTNYNRIHWKNYFFDKLTMDGLI